MHVQVERINISASPAQEPKLLHGDIEILETTIGRAANALSELEQRLKPGLRPMPMPAAATADRTEEPCRPVCCDIRAKVQELAGNAESLAAWIVTLTDRVDL